MTQDQIFEKFISAIVTLFLVLATTYDEFNSIFIIFGQGHFLAAYYFQYRAGKVNRAYFNKYTAAFAVVFGGSALLHPSAHTVFCIASVWFGIHAISDELFLIRSKPSFSRTLLALTIIAEYAWISIMPQDVHTDNSWIILLSLALIGLGCFIKHWTYEKVDGIDIYLFILILLFSSIIICNVNKSIHPIIGCLVIYHYSNWYINNFLRFQNDQPRLGHYLWAVLSINISLIVIYLFSLAFQQFWFIRYYFFSTFYFNLWTIMHMFMTLRLEDRVHLSPRLITYAMRQ